MVFRRISHILPKPLRCSISISCLFRRKFDLSKKNSLIFPVEHIQLNKKPVFFRNYVAVFCNKDTIGCGNMGSAMIGGILRQGIFSKDEIIVSNLTEEGRERSKKNQKPRKRLLRKNRIT